MSNILKINILLITVVLLAGCTATSTTSFHDTTIIDYKLKYGKPLPPNEWHVYNVEDEKICVPSTWGFVKQDKFLFVSDISRMSPGAYFTVVKYNIKKSGFDERSFMRKLYSEIQNDRTASLTGYQTIESRYTDKDVFNSEFYTSINGVPYVTHSTVFERDENLFEIAMKIERSKAKVFQETYKDIMFNFYHKNELVFSIKDKIIGAKFIDLSKLN